MVLFLLGVRSIRPEEVLPVLLLDERLLREGLPPVVFVFNLGFRCWLMNWPSLGPFVLSGLL